MQKTIAETSDKKQQARRTRCRHCGDSWTGLRIAHCATCHRTFTTPNLFDKHRAGMKGTGVPSGECHDPEWNGMVLNERGQWSMPNDGAYSFGGDTA